jgi:hypothetical protein
VFVRRGPPRDRGFSIAIAIEHSSSDVADLWTLPVDAELAQDIADFGADLRDPWDR